MAMTLGPGSSGRLLRLLRAVALLTALTTVAACGDDDDVTEPTDVTFGETTLVFVANPVVNDVNTRLVRAPGDERSGVSISVEGGPSGITGSDGILVLAPVSAGDLTITIEAAGLSDALDASIDEAELQELAFAFSGGSADGMATVEYDFNGPVVEVTPEMSVDEVNDALGTSNAIVFFRSGIYSGDLEFSGSSVTLFGEGPEGGNVTLDGNVTVSGSSNRVRGARITGDLSVPGSDAAISFSSVLGSLTVDGSDAVLLNNAFCGNTTITGSGLLALGNRGLDPLPPPSGGC